MHQAPPTLEICIPPRPMSGFGALIETYRLKWAHCADSAVLAKDLHALGLYYLHWRKTRRAMICFERAANLVPKNPAYVYAKACVYLLFGRMSKHYALEKIISPVLDSIGASFPKLFIAAAEILIEEKSENGALHMLSAASNLRKMSIPALCNDSGCFSFDVTNYGEAIRQFQKAIDYCEKKQMAVCVNYVLATYNLGLARFMKGDARAAFDAFKKAATLGDERVRAYSNYMMAVILHLGMTPEKNHGRIMDMLREADKTDIDVDVNTALFKPLEAPVY